MPSSMLYKLSVFVIDVCISYNLNVSTYQDKVGKLQILPVGWLHQGESREVDHE